jgi:TRAP-type mannitol/chloroaromatic compound transport system permease large subunit
VASGIVCTAGTLGQIIPPSTLLIILADVMSNAYQQAQYEQGKFSVEALSVGQFFAAAIVPGLMLVTLYLVYILIRGAMRPQDMPPADHRPARPDRREVLAAIVPPGAADRRRAGRDPRRHRHPHRSRISVGAIGALC